MNDGRLSHLEIDALLSGCRRLMRRDPSMPVHIEHMVLALEYCLDHFDPVTCRRHILENGPGISDSLTRQSIDAFNFETLQALPRVLDAYARAMPGGLPGNDEGVDKLISERMLFHRHVLGEIPLEDVPARFHGELAEYSSEKAGDKAHLVFVSRAPGNIRAFDIAKVLRARLDARFIGEWSLTGSYEPIISFEKRIIEYTDPFAVQLRRSVYLAEDLMVGKHRLKELRKVPREYRFGVSPTGDGPDWAGLFTGGSAGLGFAMLAMAGIGSLGLSRSAVTVSPECAFTGSLDDEGNVSGVEDFDITAKTRAVFYSPCRRFILPEENLSTAARELDRLEAAHPGRKLEIGSVKSARELAEGGEVLDTRRLSSWSVTGGRLKRRRKLSVILAFLAVIIAMAAILVPPVFDHEISDFRLRSGEVELINRFGVQFASYPLGYHVNVKDNDYDSYAARSHRFHHTDVDGDGDRELVLINVESAPNKNRATGRIRIHLFDSDGKLIGEYAPWDSLALVGEESTSVYRDFTYNWDALGDFDRDGYGELVLSSIDIAYYPAIICNIRLRDGRSSLFVHRGHMTRFVTGDFDRDGSGEIVAGGESGIFGSAVLAVLDPLHMEGVSPEAGFTIDSLPSDDTAMMYILIPVSRLRHILPGCNKPFIDKIVVSPEQTVQLSVFESADLREIHSIGYYLDREWKCYKIDIHSSYYEYVAAHYGLSDDELADTLAVYREELKKGFRYWDGEGWVAQPTINPAYLEVLEKPEDLSSFDD